MKKLILLLTLILCVNTVSKAHDFSAVNSDGDTIYYKILTNSTVGVTYKGSGYVTYKEYSDTIVIPSNILYNNISYNITSIEDGAFFMCDSLKHVILPNTIKRIRKSAFVNTNIKNITLPNDIDTLGLTLFSNSPLVSITILSKKPPYITGSTTFHTIPDSIEIHVLCGDSIIYKNTQNFTRFTNIIADQQIRNEINQTICNGTIYNQNGFNDSIQGTYYKMTQTSNGCDSLTILNLFVNPTYTTIIFDTICDNYAYNQNGFYEISAGVYTHTLQTINGCDSIVTLYLTVNPTYTTTIYDTICFGTNYTSNGFDLGDSCTSGIYISLTIN